jgi:hypothetical protein
LGTWPCLGDIGHPNRDGLRAGQQAKRRRPRPWPRASLGDGPKWAQNKRKANCCLYEPFISNREKNCKSENFFFSMHFPFPLYFSLRHLPVSSRQIVLIFDLIRLSQSRYFFVFASPVSFDVVSPSAPSLFPSPCFFPPGRPPLGHTLPFPGALRLRQNPSTRFFPDIAMQINYHPNSGGTYFPIISPGSHRPSPWPLPFPPALPLALGHAFGAKARRPCDASLGPWPGPPPPGAFRPCALGPRPRGHKGACR